MPAQDGVGLDDDDRLFPPAQLAAQEDDERPVAPGENLYRILPHYLNRLAKL